MRAKIFKNTLLKVEIFSFEAAGQLIRGSTMNSESGRISRPSLRSSPEISFQNSDTGSPLPLLPGGAKGGESDAFVAFASSLPDICLVSIPSRSVNASEIPRLPFLGGCAWPAAQLA